jgi:hypothetical protein
VTSSVRPNDGVSPPDDDVGSETSEATGQEFPGIDFATFILSLSHSVYLYLGDAPNPLTGKVEHNLPMARQTIDLLGLLEQKTQGNLTGEEERVLEQVLYELRLRYIEVARG